jgi:hypothetical protein
MTTPEPADDVDVARVIADWDGPQDGSLPPYEGLRVDQAIPLVVHLARHGYTVVATHPDE